MRFHPHLNTLYIYIRNIIYNNNNNNNNNNLNVIQANNIVEDFLYDNMPDDDTSYYKKEEENNEYAHQLESKILFDAIYKDDAALIHNAISNTVDLNTRNPEGFTPLLYAIHYDKTNALNILLSYTNKIDINKNFKYHYNSSLIFLIILYIIGFKISFSSLEMPL